LHCRFILYQHTVCVWKNTLQSNIALLDGSCCPDTCILRQHDLPLCPLSTCTLLSIVNKATALNQSCRLGKSSVGGLHLRPTLLRNLYKGGYGCCGVCLPNKKLPAPTSPSAPSTMESPMEYQWTTGPKMDPASPFTQLGMQQESKKRTSVTVPPEEALGSPPPNAF